MAATREENFWKAIEEKAFDKRHKETLNYNLGNYETAFRSATAKYQDLENSKKKAHLVKWKAIDNIERYLLDFESMFVRGGGRVVWANTAEEALEEVDKIISQQQTKAIVKSHTMIAEEIGLQNYLNRNGIDVVETDLGRHLNVLDKSTPSHVINTAIHLGFEEIVELFHQKHQLPKESSPEDLLKAMRLLYKDKIEQCTVAITGADYLVADTGSVVIAENEGNGRLSSAFAKSHIVLAGIDKIIPSINDLDLFLPLKSAHDYGRAMNTFHTILSGPKRIHEVDGPEEMIVILIDNGRTNLLAQKELRQGLYAMECGASTNACQVYRNIGGHAYQTVYPGPMGALFTPYLIDDLASTRYLSNISAFTQANPIPSPLRIDIPRLLLLNRREYVEQNMVLSIERKWWKWYTKLSKSRKLLDFFGSGIKNFLLRLVAKKDWGKRRDFPKVADRSFSKQWQMIKKERE